MTISRSIRYVAIALGALALSGCTIYEGADAVCPHADPNSPDWPYCGPANPGGSQPTGSGPRY